MGSLCFPTRELALLLCVVVCVGCTAAVDYHVVEKQGHEQLKLREWASALEYFTAAEKAREQANDRSFDLLYTIGLTHYQIGRSAEAKSDERRHLDLAIKSWATALELEPDNELTHYNIVVACAAGGDWKNTVGWGEEYVGLVPGDHNGWRLLHRAYTELGEDEKAAGCRTRFEAIEAKAQENGE